MSNYRVPSEKEYFVGHFDLANNSKCESTEDNREWNYYPIAKKLFVDVTIAGATAFLCASFDAIDMYRHQEKKNESLFVDIDWIINEQIGGKSVGIQLKRLKKEVITNIKKSESKRLNEK